MKIEKNKIVAASIVGIVVLFIIFYSITLFGNDADKNTVKEAAVPDLQEEKEDYKSKLEAVDAIKEEKEKLIPTVYDESKLDENGYFIEDKEEKDKQKIIDSIYNAGKIHYRIPTKKHPQKKHPENKKQGAKKLDFDSKESLEEIKKSQKDFFKANNKSPKKDNSILGATDPLIYAEVNGNQLIKNNNRLEMRLTKDAIINGFLFKKNTYVYGTTQFKPNRIIVTINSINNKPVAIEAYDVQDGGLGIYVENSLSAEASLELSRDLSSEIGETLPGVSTLKRLFRKKQKKIKVKVINKYQLLLKLKQ